ncbi:MAG: 3-deoxy-7-phosphoheptulonate synthase, partial [Actinomycetota bacterium]
MSTPQRTWTPSSWMDLPAEQMPEYPDPDHLKQVLETLSTQPPLVFAGEARDLTADLARVCRGEAFLLQGGDCAETFDAAGADATRDKLKALPQKRGRNGRKRDTPSSRRRPAGRARNGPRIDGWTLPADSPNAELSR